jgi:hypothetical protein
MKKFVIVMFAAALAMSMAMPAFASTNRHHKKLHKHHHHAAARSTR